MNVREGRIFYSLFAVFFFAIMAVLMYFLPSIIEPVHNTIGEQIECWAIIVFIIVGAIGAILWGIILVEDSIRDKISHRIRIKRIK